MRRALVFCFLANGAAAQSGWEVSTDERALLDALGVHGCTLGEASATALKEAGFTQDEIQLTALKAQAAGLAEPQGDYVVFAADICTIRLPQIDSLWSMADLSANNWTAPWLDDQGDDFWGRVVANGCVLEEEVLLAALPADPKREGFDTDFEAFVATQIIAGDIRLYATDHAPTFHFTTGPCDSLPKTADIIANHAILVSEFGRFVRDFGAQTHCSDRRSSLSIRLSHDLQMGQSEDGHPPLNTALFAEYGIIAGAMGWSNGINFGDLQPPLCNYDS